MPFGNVEQQAPDQRRRDEVDEQNSGRLLLQNQDGVLADGLDCLKLCSTIRKSEAGQIDSLPPQRPRFQRCGEHDRIMITNGQQFRTPQRQSGNLAQRHIGDIANVKFWRLAHPSTLGNPSGWPGAVPRSRKWGDIRRRAAPGHCR